ncbi:septum formation inhibitor Maf [Brevibacillus sp. HB1.2]|uniref:dTTP/UTP pyrophosphatase n=1 Tax=Brevibacillus porteri TaxID=2126350 RepID=A0ABX5FY76_9BACL|nr:MULTISPECIES: Maf family protein [Brevibacillus]ATF12408.1 septum formation inhibitor Maf [Brevibacillus brevis X23]MDC0763304.1 Maf family protein [Brevibacillus sp. AG]MED1798980.1 Maf family protein [Brevibacillus porteri]MED2130112.1 Maf family protein [Brevibacillus porteri]MED2746530.1 Maf family protein [Brevibacillus porteri]
MTKKNVPLILASSSPRRRELLQALGLSFTVITSDVDETTAEHLSASEVVEELSLRKAKEVASRLTEGVVLGSDTVVVLDGQILGKPVDEMDAYRMLSMLQGQEHTVYSGVALIDVETGRAEVSHSLTHVRIRALTEQEIKSYIATGEPMDKAGSYAIQGIGATIVEGITGDYFTVVGLPLGLTSTLLTRFGMPIL